MLKSFFHTGFVVKDIEASIKFYAEVLGMRIAGRTEREGEFVEQVLAFPGAHIKGGFVDMGVLKRFMLRQVRCDPCNFAKRTSSCVRIAAVENMGNMRQHGFREKM